ncbi:MAG: arginase family protein [Gaiellales bacterium]
MSALRARCPDCGSVTAVALDDRYECHVCGKGFRGGLVRVAGAWGVGGEEMASAAKTLRMPWPEVAVVSATSLPEQTEAVERSLPALPIVLGGCCCSHVGAIRGLARRHERLAVVWFDAHGDLNTPETSPSGNEWGMPLRMAIDAGDVQARRVALVGARSLDPPEIAFLAATEIDDDVERAVADASAVYVAFDLDVLAPEAVMSFMPEPGGMSLADARGSLAGVVATGCPVVGIGFSGTVAESDPGALVALAAAAGV